MTASGAGPGGGAGWRWRDARAAAGGLRRRPADRRALLLLARLPLLPTAVMGQLAGLRGGASIYRGLRRLRGGGLVGAVRVPLAPGHSPRLFYLTDLGVAAVALDQGVAAGRLARRCGLRRADLLRLLAGLPQLLATYALLAAVAASRPGRPDLLAWERPWRRRYQRPAAKHPSWVTLPAYAAVAWGGAAAECLLVPDLATFPLRVYRPALARLVALWALGGAPPALVVATTDPGRARAWEQLVEETCRAGAEAPLVARVVTWDALPGPGRSAGPARPGAPDGVAGPTDAAPGGGTGALVRRVRLPGASPAGEHRPLPRLVGRLPVGGAPAGGALGTGGPGGRDQSRGSGAALDPDVLRLATTDRALLDLVGRHPFLRSEQLAVLLGCPVGAARRRCARLRAAGLLRSLELDGGRPGAAPEVSERRAGEPAGEEPSDRCERRDRWELTESGLTLVAAQEGLSLAAAVRANGLAGGGPERPVGARRTLLRRLAHTVGADGVFVRLAAAARRRAAAGADDALLEWRNAAACAWRHVRPDGYGLYRHAGRLYGLFLEYDRGTMTARDHRRKFGAYHHYLASGRFEREYRGFPTVLVVTAGPGPEARIAAAVRSAGVGWAAPLPVLLTTTGRLAAARDGLLGPIWRTPDPGPRRRWPATAGAAAPARPPWPAGRAAGS